MGHAEILQLFHRMSDGMAKIQERAFALLSGILFHHRALYLTALLNHRKQNIHLVRANRSLIFQQPLKILPILNQAMLQNLSHTGSKLPLRKGLKHRRVDVYQPRHMERADHIFIAVEVHTGLAADAAVHLG